LAAAGRSRIIARLQVARANRHRIASGAALAGLLGDGAGQDCLTDRFTLVSGLAMPRSSTEGPAPTEPGSALRIRAQSGGGRSLVAIVRLTASGGAPVAVSTWSLPCTNF